MALPARIALRRSELALAAAQGVVDLLASIGPSRRFHPDEHDAALQRARRALADAQLRYAATRLTQLSNESEKAP